MSCYFKASSYQYVDGCNFSFHGFCRDSDVAENLHLNGLVSFVGYLFAFKWFNIFRWLLICI